MRFAESDITAVLYCHMAQKKVVTLVDDITDEDIPDGTGETVSFAHSKTYEIDLARQNADTLRSLFRGCIPAGSHSATTPGKREKTAVRPDAKVLRRWGRVSGFGVPHRGHIRDEVRAAYESAN